MSVPRAGALLLAATVLVTPVTASVYAPATATASDASPRLGSPVKAAHAASWLAGELVNNRMHVEFGGERFTDWGLTVDTLFALSAEGSKARRVAKIAGVLGNHVNDYTDFMADRYAGASAKLLLGAKVAGRDVRDFGGHNLRQRLLDLVAGPRAGFQHGRLKDRSESDFSNAISQSLGVIGLSRTGRAPQSTLDFLLKQRCAAGWFRLLEESDGRCRRKQDAPDVDATAYAAQALVAARADGADIPDGAVRESSAWLNSAQRGSGAFGGGASTSGANTNSTGLAALALVATGRDRAAAKAAEWVAGLQLTPRRAKGTPARDEVGAIAYDRAAYRVAVRGGIPRGDADRDQYRRATAQGIFAFAPKPLTTLRVPRS